MNNQWYSTLAVITGAYGGLGEEICKQLDDKGVSLILTGRNSDKLQQLKSELKNVVDVLSGDVADMQFRDDLKKLLKQHQSHKHVFINNAGISDVNFLQNQTDEDLERMLQVNLLAPILISKAVLPWLHSANSGKLINIGSTFGAIGYPGFSGYCASKFGLRGFSQALARELADTNVDVQYLAPRAVATKINSSAVNHLNSELKNKVDSPQQIVPQIISAIEKGNSEQFFGWPEKLFVKVNGLFPKVVSGSIKKEHQKIKQILTQ